MKDEEDIPNHRIQCVVKNMVVSIRSYYVCIYIKREREGV